MKVGIVGASGYSGEVLVKLLLSHPRVTLAAVTSRTHAGKSLAAVIPAVRGLDRGLKFSDSDPAAQQEFKNKFGERPTKIQSQHPDRRLQVFPEDEARFGQQGTLPRVWARTDSRPRVSNKPNTGSSTCWDPRAPRRVRLGG